MPYVEVSSSQARSSSATQAVRIRPNKQWQQLTRVKTVFSEGTDFNDFYVPTPLRMGTSIVRTSRTKIGLFLEDWMHQSAFWVSCVELAIEHSIHYDPLCTYYRAYQRNIIFQVVGTVVSPGPDKKCLQCSKRMQKFAVVNWHTFYFRPWKWHSHVNLNSWNINQAPRTTVAVVRSWHFGSSCDPALVSRRCRKDGRCVLWGIFGAQASAGSWECRSICTKDRTFNLHNLYIVYIVFICTSTYIYKYIVNRKRWRQWLSEC